MQHLEKLVILTLLILVLIYTILVNRTIIPKDLAPAPKPETHLSGSSSATNKDSFFPPPGPPMGEDITEESFTESP
ncbi:MAG: hypothetical protein O3A78_12005 [Nitrospinae bacterium]|nr:hypothetical protein [Nitrospinota bacterium]MDA1110509.1 hypothetical protein [Nitrospinota bacterium]